MLNKAKDNAYKEAMWTNEYKVEGNGTKMPVVQSMAALQKACFDD